MEGYNPSGLQKRSTVPNLSGLTHYYDPFPWALVYGRYRVSPKHWTLLLGRAESHYEYIIPIPLHVPFAKPTNAGISAALPKVTNQSLGYLNLERGFPPGSALSFVCF